MLGVTEEGQGKAGYGLVREIELVKMGHRGQGQVRVEQ